ncbi:MAG: peptidylprolyl isomerase, partial [Pseudomonadota bacterium]
MRLLKVAMAAILFAGLSAFTSAHANPENTMIITLADGEVSINLRDDLAPQHVARIKELVRAGEYDNVAFHRVIPGFMAQTGDVEYGDMEDAA